MDSTALDSMRGSVWRMLAAGEGVDLLKHTRGPQDDRLLGLLLLGES